MPLARLARGDGRAAELATAALANGALLPVERRSPPEALPSPGETVEIRP